MKTHRLLNKILLFSLSLSFSHSLSFSLYLPFSLFTAACASFAFLAAVFQLFKCHKWSFVKYIVSFFLFENGFLHKLSLANSSLTYVAAFTASIYIISYLHLLHNISTNLSPLWILLYKYFSSLEIPRNYSTIFRGSHQRCFIKKAILKHSVIFTEKHLCRGLFFDKVAGHQACNFIKKRLQHRCYLVNIRKVN